MHEAHSRNHGRSPGTISRREFMRIGAMASLLAGCSSAVEQVAVTATPASIPADARLSLQDALGRVVRARHTGAWSGDALVPAALTEMLDAAVTSLTGIGDASDAWQALFSPIGFLLVISFLVSFGLTNFEGVFGLYAKERFNYDAKQVGLVLVVIGLLSAIVQGVLTGPFTKRWGEAVIIRASLLGSAVGFLLMLRARSDVSVMVTVGFFVVSNAMLRPAVSSMISKRTSSGQGVAMGLNNSFMSLGRIVGPPWAGILFDINLSLPYLSGSAIMLAGFLMSLFWLESTAPQPRASEAPAGKPEPRL